MENQPRRDWEEAACKLVGAHKKDQSHKPFKKEGLIKYAKCCQELKVKWEVEMTHWTKQHEIFGNADRKCFAEWWEWNPDGSHFKSELEDSKWKQRVETYLLGNGVLKPGQRD